MFVNLIGKVYWQSAMYIKLKRIQYITLRASVVLKKILAYIFHNIDFHCNYQSQITILEIL